ncbi:MAG: hypothetical protein U0670_15305 [Anaerolineae bacterium]
MSTSNNSPSRILVWDDIILDLQDALASMETAVYIVGGAVRDAYMRRPIKDIDMATPGSGMAVARKIANVMRGDYYALDSERNVGRALVKTSAGTLSFDVATFRGVDLTSDLLDRDFTINAMAVDLRGNLNALIDPLGGEQDLLTRVIRRCNPHAVLDDPIRALRGVRQSVKYGFRIEPETLKDMRAAAASLHQVSPERMRDELFNLLVLEKPEAALRIVEAVGLLQVIAPETAVLRTLPGQGVFADGFTLAMHTLEQLNQLLAAISPQRSDHTAAQFTLGTFVMVSDRYRKALQTHLETTYPNDRAHRALLNLSVLCGHLDYKAMEDRAAALRLSNTERDRLAAIARSRDAFMQFGFDEPTPLMMYRFWRATGPAGVDVLLISLARYLAAAGPLLKQDEWLRVVEQAGALFSAYFEHYDEWVEPPALLDGRQLIAQLHIKSGPIIGEILERIREAQVDGQIHTSVEALALARQILQHPRDQGV